MPETRQAAGDILDGISAGLPATMPLYALLTALAATFVALCDDHAIDATAALEQVMGTLARDPGSVGARESAVSGLEHLER